MRRHRVIVTVKAPDEFSQHKVEDLLHGLITRAMEKAHAANSMLRGEKSLEVTRLLVYKPRVNETRQLYGYVMPHRVDDDAPPEMRTIPFVNLLDYNAAAENDSGQNRPKIVQRSR